MIVGTVRKMPSEVITRAIDFTGDLASGETVTSIISAIALDQNGVDVSASLVGPAAPLILGGGTNVALQLQDGILNSVYNVTLTVGSSNANTFQATLVLYVGLSIDLTTVGNVAGWIAPYTVGKNPAEDQVIQDAVTAFSAYAIRATGRATMGGSIPPASPFVAPVAYDEFYDGSGTWRQPVRNWPINRAGPISVFINSSAIAQSTAPNTPGWVVDGDGRFISIRFGYNSTVATFANYGWQYNRGGGLAGLAPGGFASGIQNVEIIYSAGFNGVPFDLEMLARKVVALNYKRRSWIGQRSQAMANGAGTVSYNDWEMDAQDRSTLNYYKAMVVA